MKRNPPHIAEVLYCLAFLLYLYGSSLAHIENGTELSLWLMAFAVALTVAVTVLPIAGVRWLKMDRYGSRTGYRVALLMQGISWLTFFWAMFHRLSRNLPTFHSWVTITTLLWAAWLLTLIFSRRVRAS